MELPNLLELSENKTKKLFSLLWKSLGHSDVVMSNLDKKIVELQETYNDFYKCKTEEFIDDNQMVTSEFIKLIIKERGLNNCYPMFKISLGGRENFLKALVNIFILNNLFF